MSHSTSGLIFATTPFGSYCGPFPLSQTRTLRSQKNPYTPQGHRADECRSDEDSSQGQLHFPVAAVTQHHTLSGLMNRDFSSHCSGSSKFKIKAAAGPKLPQKPVESSLPLPAAGVCQQSLAFLGLWIHTSALCPHWPWPLPSCVLLSFSKDSGHMGVLSAKTLFPNGVALCSSQG